MSFKIFSISFKWVSSTFKIIYIKNKFDFLGQMKEIILIFLGLPLFWLKIEPISLLCGF